MENRRRTAGSTNMARGARYFKQDTCSELCITSSSCTVSTSVWCSGDSDPRRLEHKTRTPSSSCSISRACMLCTRVPCETVRNACAWACCNGANNVLQPRGYPRISRVQWHTYTHTHHADAVQRMKGSSTSACSPRNATLHRYDRLLHPVPQV